jgi:DNA mismatch repair protein MutL
MGKIRILPDNLVSKIAAGEIVERPASVVKELVENSLDAGSTAIKIELEAGGKRLIRVSDDGLGMSRDEALLSLERHATSKIKDLEDLFSVSSFGFRGEAVPSIASVSRFRITTKPEAEVIGTEVSIQGGVIKKVEETGSPGGTTIEVKNLFFNTPARHKFMKRTETELSNVLAVTERLALSSPGCSFELTHDGRTLLRLQRRDKTSDRVAEIFPNCVLFRVSAEANAIRIKGFMSSPLDTRSNTQKLFTFVNGRGVKDRFLTRILIDAYGKMLEKGKFPQGALYVEIPYADVDVNVHPTKSEVRFQNTRIIGDLVKSAIQGMLKSAPWLKDYKVRTDNITRKEFSGRELRTHFGSHSPGSTEYRSDQNIDPRNVQNHAYSGHIDSRSIKDTVTHSSQVQENIDRENIGEEPGELFGAEGFYSSLKIIGQLGDLYLVCAYGEGMILIDQHAAHERINYEKIKNAYLELSPLQVQELLVPEVIELSPYEANLIGKQRKELLALGLRVEDFGQNSVVLRSAPALIKSTDYSELLKDIIAEMGEGGGEKSLSERIERVISTMACHASIRASFELNYEKMESLLKELDGSEFPHSCPHGRPVAQKLSYQQIERMFKRT